MRARVATAMTIVSTINPVSSRDDVGRPIPNAAAMGRRQSGHFGAAATSAAVAIAPIDRIPYSKEGQRANLPHPRFC